MNKSGMHTKMPKLHDAVRLQIKKAFALLVAVIFMGLTMWSNRTYDVGKLSYIYSSIFVNVIVLSLNYVTKKYKNYWIKVCVIVNIVFLVDLCYIKFSLFFVPDLKFLLDDTLLYVIINFLISIVSSILYRM